jgi:integrase
MIERRRSRFQRRPRADGSRSHRYQYNDPVTGRRESKTFASEAELAIFKRRLTTLREDVAAGRIAQHAAARELAAVAGDRVTVDALWSRYVRTLTNNNTKQTARSVYTNRLAHDFADLEWWQLTPERMGAWHARLHKRYRDASVRLAFDLLCAAYRLALDSGRIDHIPWRAWRPRRLDQQLERPCATSIEDLAALVFAARAEDERAWSKGRPSFVSFSVLILTLTGLRQAEAAGLGWDCLELETTMPMMQVRYQSARNWRAHPESAAAGRPKLPPKGRRARVQVLHEGAARALRVLREHLRAHDLYRPDGPVFPRLHRPHRGDWRDCVVLSSAKMKQLARAAGLPRPDEWVTHSTRHGFATLETKASGGDLDFAKARTGHADARVLMGYLHRGGTGLAQSKVPALAPELVPAPAVLTEGQATTPAPLLPGDSVDGGQLAPELEARLAVRGGLVDLVNASAGRLRALEERRDARARAQKERDKRPFIELAREWLVKPGAGPRPPEVTRRARACYTRAYARAAGRGETQAEARRAGQASQRACFGAWAQALKKAVAERNAETRQ